MWGGANGLSGGGRLPADEGGEGTATSPWLYNSLADAGDVDGDGTADVVAPAHADGTWGLAVYYGPFDRTGAPRTHRVPRHRDEGRRVPQGAGAVTVLRGGPNGVTTTGAQVITQNTWSVPSTSEAKDHFGTAVHVAAGGAGEVLVGGIGEDGGKGRVRRLPTTASGVTGVGSTSFNIGVLSGRRVPLTSVSTSAAETPLRARLGVWPCLRTRLCS
ncbi:hypothetical protein [Streptomyces sp. SAS_270]|uniref:hypothetical protein n=1 Tax=Streptomyces sp. SAS_270 TaxID=3412748 RepID=UPI00403CC5D5